jgi:hypothetical protein
LVNEGGEGLTDNKIQNGRRFKGKTAELCYFPHDSDYCDVKCYNVFGVKEFLKMIIGCGKTK